MSETKTKDPSQRKRTADYVEKYELVRARLTWPKAWVERLHAEAENRETSASHLMLTLFRGLLEAKGVTDDALPWQHPIVTAPNKKPSGKPLGRFTKTGTRKVWEFNRRGAERTETLAVEALGAIGSERMKIAQRYLEIDPIVGADLAAIAERVGTHHDDLLRLAVEMLRLVEPDDGLDVVPLVGSAARQARYMATRKGHASARIWIEERVGDAFRRERREEAEKAECGVAELVPIAEMELVPAVFE